MVGKRKYDEGCAIAHALDLVGERWSLLVVRELLLGPKRFSDLLSGLPGVSTDMLTLRLRELAAAGVVRRRRLARPAASWVYELTSWGMELEPLVESLGRWGARSPGLRPDAPVGTDSVLLSLKALFDTAAAAGFTATLALRLGEDDFRVVVEDGRIDIGRGGLDRPDATLECDVPTVLTLLRTDRSLDEVLAGGAARLDGDRSVVERWRRLFPLPQPVPVEDRT
ncbi:helix-turn-helix domain-containing protein [Micromonospora sp. NPDC049559]|uniref:winged helix-turn-helix transcriptional regulator n=1 Tax=Micromonospora sp. NPDC049559 TaxID=3155923 RepID=UPI00342E4BA3